MSLPQGLLDRLEPVVGRISRADAVGGGCISSAASLDAGGERLFLKYERGSPDGFFAAEAAGLERLRSAGTGLLIPRVVGYEDAGSGWSWLAMEWLESGSRSADASEALGAGLARLHRQIAERWGANLDGFIGSLPQRNAPTADWSTFWWERRLEPQLRIAPGVGHAELWSALEARLGELLEPADADGASLLHGDLWGGNVLWSVEGPALIDPCSYDGHREVDLAMSELFGGFDQGFYEGYTHSWPLEAGYEARKGAYQLYYLLVHVNLFGASYIPRTLDTLRRVLRKA
ncbi:MAG: fructosamine kinase family protein [Gemmatimonadota bacterium]